MKEALYPITTGLTPVAPVRPAAGYIGGKRNLATRLVALIEQIPHQAYFEPFVGMGGVFLRRRSRPKVEAINDISGDVATFFRVLQRHYPYFLDMLRWRVASRAEFNRLRDQVPETLTDLERAARFLYLQKLAFGGKVDGRNFGVDASQGARFNITKLEPMLAEIHERIAGVTIEQLTYGTFIGKYDRPGALFYLDPPYFDCEGDYGPGVFARDDFERLAEQLGRLMGSFLLSINDRPEVREIFSAFVQVPVSTTYQIGLASRPAGELIIAGGAPAIAAIEASAL
ncbi:MAG: DNA adenine methylase [Pseudomonadota bacterium]